MSTENAPDTQVKKPKAKKRGQKKDKLKDKPEDRELDKSEAENTKSEKRKSKKRKSKHEEVSQVEENEHGSDTSVESKRAKPDMNPDASENGTEETKGDTKAPKGPSKRQLKREKAEKRENDKREISKLEATQKSLNYISKWKHAKSEWKFEKLRQIWLMDNLLDEKSIPDDMFLIVLEYFEGSKGMARKQLIQKGMAVIKKAEEDEENRDSIVESVAYIRARELLQALPTDT